MRRPPLKWPGAFDKTSFGRLNRGQLMARVRSTGNQSTEVKLARILRAREISGWRRHYPVKGKPDFVFLKHRIAVFVDGCFWHGCPLHSTLPRNNRALWLEKLEGNKSRDKRTTRSLRAQGWRVIRVWEHDLLTPENVAHRIRLALNRKPRTGAGVRRA